jgi:hypothetical protein
MFSRLIITNIPLVELRIAARHVFLADLWTLSPARNDQTAGSSTACRMKIRLALKHCRPWPESGCSTKTKKNKIMFIGIVCVIKLSEQQITLQIINLRGKKEQIKQQMTDLC